MSEQQEQQAILERLDKVLASLKARIEGRSPFQKVVMVSATTPIVLDYRDRKFVYLYSANALTLSLEDLGTIAIPANTWINISFSPGLFIYAQGQVANVPVFLKQTDDALSTDTMSLVAGTTVSLTANQSVNVAQMGGQATAMSGSDGQAGSGVPLETSGLYNPATPGIERQRTPTVFKVLAEVAVTAGTPVSVWTPAAGKKFRIMGWFLTMSVSGAILIEDSTGVSVLRNPKSAANQPSAAPPMGNGYLSTAANNQVFVDVTATGAVSGVIFGTEE